MKLPRPMILSALRDPATGLITLQVSPNASLQVQARLAVNGQTSPWSDPFMVSTPPPPTPVPDPPPVPIPTPPPASVTVMPLANLGVGQPGVSQNSRAMAALGDLCACYQGNAYWPKAITLFRGNAWKTTTLGADVAQEWGWNAQLALTPGYCWLFSNAYPAAYQPASWTTPGATGMIVAPWQSWDTPRPPTLRCYAINADLGLEFVSAMPVGNVDCNASALLGMPDGSVMALVTELPARYPEDGNNLRVWLAKCAPWETWPTQVWPRLATIDGTATWTGQARTAFVRHPDGSFWLFSKGDSVSRMLLTRFVGDNPAIVTQTTIISPEQGPLNVEGEFPNLVATVENSDPFKGSNVSVAYQCDQSIYYSTTPFWKGSKVAKAVFNQVGSLLSVGLLVDDYVERVWGMNILDGGILVARPHALDPTFLTVGAKRLPDGPWVTLGRTGDIAMQIPGVANLVAIQDGTSGELNVVRVS